MFGDERRLDPVDQRSESRQRRCIGRLGAGERKRNAVQRHGMRAADFLQPGHAGPAGDQVVLGMHLEPQAAGPAGERLFVVLGLQAEPGRQGGHDCACLAMRLQVLAESEPVPLGVFIVVQVPLATAFQALAW